MAWRDIRDHHWLLGMARSRTWEGGVSLKLIYCVVASLIQLLWGCDSQVKVIEELWAKDSSNGTEMVGIFCVYVFNLFGYLWFTTKFLYKPIFIYERSKKIKIVIKPKPRNKWAYMISIILIMLCLLCLMFEPGL